MSPRPGVSSRSIAVPAIRSAHETGRVCPQHDPDDEADDGGYSCLRAVDCERDRNRSDCAEQPQRVQRRERTSPRHSPSGDARVIENVCRRLAQAPGCDCGCGEGGGKKERWPPGMSIGLWRGKLPHSAILASGPGPAPSPLPAATIAATEEHRSSFTPIRWIGAFGTLYVHPTTAIVRKRVTRFPSGIEEASVRPSRSLP